LINPLPLNFPSWERHFREPQCISSGMCAPTLARKPSGKAPTSNPYWLNGIFEYDYERKYSYVGLDTWVRWRSLFVATWYEEYSSCTLISVFMIYLHTKFCVLASKVEGTTRKVATATQPQFPRIVINLSEWSNENWENGNATRGGAEQLKFQAT
jgi:hypothetical protein